MKMKVLLNILKEKVKKEEMFGKVEWIGLWGIVLFLKVCLKIRR
jgi:hypothetical protein